MIETDEIGFTSLLETVSNIGQQLFLVRFDGQKVVATFGPNLGGDFLLAAHGVDAHQGSVEFEQFQELGNGRDFIGFLVHGDLAQTQMVLGGPGTDQVQRAEVGGPGATDRFSVDSDLFDPHGSGKGQHPFSETVLERHGIEALKDSLKGIMAWDASRQCEESFEPVMPLTAKGSNLGPTVAAGDDSANSDDQDVQEKVSATMSAARVFEFAEVLLDGQGSGSHTVSPG